MITLKQKDLVYPVRLEDSHKGQNGRVLIVGGNEDYVGAVALAGLAALRSGADRVTVVSPENVGWAVNALSPDLVVRKLKGIKFRKEHIQEIRELEKDHDVVLIGNGLGDNVSFVQEYVSSSTMPMVVDADAFRVISLNMLRKSILTPHRKEFTRLLKNSGIGNTTELKKAIGSNVVVIKGEKDEIIAKDTLIENTTGNAGMTKAGTGDVMAGLAAGFYSQNVSALEAAKLACYYNGLAGDILLKKKKGYSYLASDLVQEIERLMHPI